MQRRQALIYGQDVCTGMACLITPHAADNQYVHKGLKELILHRPGNKYILGDDSSISLRESPTISTVHTKSIQVKSNVIVWPQPLAQPLAAQVGGSISQPTENGRYNLLQLIALCNSLGATIATVALRAALLKCLPSSLLTSPATQATAQAIQTLAGVTRIN
jgi:hypothetical protein